MALGVRQKTTLFMMAACLALLGWVSIHGSLRELLAVLPNSANVAPRGDYAEVVQALTPLIEHELKEKGIPSIAVALVDGIGLVAAGNLKVAFNPHESADTRVEYEHVDALTDGQDEHRGRSIQYVSGCHLAHTGLQ